MKHLQEATKRGPGQSPTQAWGAGAHGGLALARMVVVEFVVAVVD